MFEIYKLIHFIGVFGLFLAVGGIFLHAMNGGTKETNDSRKFLSIAHGVSLFLILLGGFGMLARGAGAGLYESHTPVWAILKLVVWVIFGGIIVIPARNPVVAKLVWVLLVYFGAVAAYLGIYQPAF